MPSDKNIVEETRELLAMATPGPWQVYADGDGYCVGRDTGNTLAYGAAITGWGNVRQTKPDADLIARAPGLLRALADEVGALRRGEFICKRCHHRKDSEFEAGEF